MDRYDFRRLTDFDFEQVTKDILETSMGVRFEVFTRGADQGIDLRHLSAASGTTIVQCKHWLESGRAALLRHMRSKEIEKIRKLAPTRYILATSVDLTPTAKKTLIKDLSPYVTDPADLLGLSELEAILNTHPEITRRHIRLWLSNSNVLDALLGKDILLRSEQLVNDMNHTLKSFAPMAAMNDARDVLEANNVCIIAGVPGVGKTTLAQVLASEYVAQGHELYELSGDVSEGLRVWREEIPQVFYYDDFLGQTTLRDITSTNEDARLLGFIRKVNHSRNKKFILTTREYILSQARQRSEKLGDPSVDVSKFILDVSVLNPQERAKILYNHIYFSNLPPENRAEFARHENYLPIIGHRNFNPRLIATSLETLRSPKESATESVARVRRNLDEPMSLWQHMFDFQLNESEIALVETVFLHDEPVQLDQLQEQWSKYSLGGPAATSPTQFRRALGALEGTLLQVFRRAQLNGHNSRVELHNPSVRDFMRVRLVNNPEILRSMVTRLTDISQLVYIWNTSTGHGGKPLLQEFQKITNVVEDTATRLTTTPALNFDAIWAISVDTLLDMSFELSSDSLREAALTWLKDDWPDHFPAPWDAVALFDRFRRSDDSALSRYANELNERIIEDVMSANLSDFDDLRWAQDVVSSLEGSAAETALGTLESYLLEEASEIVRGFYEGDSFPSLDVAEQVLAILPSFGRPEEFTPGLSEFATRFEEECSRASETGRGSGFRQRASGEVFDGDVHHVMSMLLK